MGGRPRCWPVSAGLLAAAAGLGAASVALHWQPCAGQYGLGVGFEESGQAYTAACLVAMDQSSGTLLGDVLSPGGALGIAATVLLALAWLVLVPTARLSPLSRVLMALPGVLVLAQVAAAVVSALAPSDAAQRVSYGLALGVEFSILLALVVLGAGGVAGMDLFRYTLVVLATTATGYFHVIVEYIAAMSLSTANWDTPPGSGSFTVIGIAIAALLTFVLWRRDGRARAAVTPTPAAMGI